MNRLTELGGRAAVIDSIAPEDPLVGAPLETYLATGQWSLERIRLAMSAAGRRDFERIVDLPSGYGRVLRHLKAAFPDAELTAVDIDRGAVDFCRETFDATGIYSVPNPDEIAIEGPFDLVWCGSLLTHVDALHWSKFLRLFERILPVGGLLVFTVLGPFVANEQMRSRDNPYGLTRDQEDLVIGLYHSVGFGYCDYAHSKEALEERSLPENYGIALASPAWVCAQLEPFKFDLLTYTAGGWGNQWGVERPLVPTTAQDVVGCIRTR